jgi:hypothetical protein
MEIPLGKRSWTRADNGYFSTAALTRASGKQKDSKCLMQVEAGRGTQKTKGEGPKPFPCLLYFSSGF